MLINGYKLDEEQEAIVRDESQHLLVVAGAGAGKTLTILGKINYLINNKNYQKNDILCISYTKDAALSLKNKIIKEFNIEIDTFTFHKLSIEILKSYNVNFTITDNETLDRCIHEYFYIDTISNLKQRQYVSSILDRKFKNSNDYLNYLNQNYEEMQKNGELINTFIRLFKCNNNDVKNFYLYLKNSRYHIFSFKKRKAFLLIVLNIYLKYQQYLLDNKELDFDDLITNARDIIIEKGIKTQYKYIIIDEYQDSSLIRFQLINAILAKTNAKLMVVGDDFQSIYRFSGCSLDLFVNFKIYFPDARILKINTTYRNSKELIKIAGDFIMKNKLQIKKDLKSLKSLAYPIQIIYYKNLKLDFKKIIIQLFNTYGNDFLILGRNNKDINLLIDKDITYKDNKIIIKNYEEIDITFLTIHRSKGLESNNVFIINLENSICGLPSKMKNNTMLNYVNKVEEKYPYGEERRLFYVGLTRTKNYCILLVNKSNESIFVKELVRSYKKQIKIHYL